MAEADTTPTAEGGKTRKCAACGREIPVFHRLSYCPECAAKRRVEYQREYYQKRKNDAKRKAKEKSARAAAERAKKSTGRCKFCGAIVIGDEFCPTCRREGFDNVYAFTGRSNGWDRRNPPKELLKTGWRGQRPCYGGLPRLGSTE